MARPHLLEQVHRASRWHLGADRIAELARVAIDSKNGLAIGWRVARANSARRAVCRSGSRSDVVVH